MKAKGKKWRRVELISPLQFDRFDVAASVMTGQRIEGLYCKELDKNLDIQLTLVEHLRYDNTGKNTVQTFRFEGKETTSVNDRVRGEFDFIRQTCWIELEAW